VITPNKVITLRDSALGKVTAILSAQPRPDNLTALYNGLSKNFESIDQFLIALDILFILGKIQVNLSTQVVTYVD